MKEVGFMMDINIAIANNILDCLRTKGKKQTDLAEGIGVSKQTMSKMLNGGRIINAVELKRIADYLHVSMESLMRLPDLNQESDTIHTFMGKVETEPAREAIKIADQVSDLILFHAKVKRNGKAMMQPVEG